MSDKRFCETERACYYTSLVRDTLINEKLGTDKVVDLLNSLVGENEELLKKEKHLHKVITRKDKRINNLVRNKEQLKEENEQLKNYQKRAECSNFQINKLKEEIAELQEDNVDTIVELSKENEQLRQRYYALKKEIDRLDNNIIHLNEANDCRKKNLKIMELSNTEHNLKMLLANSDEQTERFIKGLQKENRELRQQLQEMKSDEKLYAQEILELNKTKKEMLNFKQLGGDY